MLRQQSTPRNSLGHLSRLVTLMRGRPVEDRIKLFSVTLPLDVLRAPDAQCW